MKTPEGSRALPAWLRALARVDCVAAVALTVVAPLVLLAQALRTARREELWALLRYWRASSLLMVTVYLLIGERRVAFPAGLAARLLIARTLLGDRAAPGSADSGRSSALRLGSISLASTAR